MYNILLCKKCKRLLYLGGGLYEKYKTTEIIIYHYHFYNVLHKNGCLKSMPLTYENLKDRCIDLRYETTTNSALLQSRQKNWKASDCDGYQQRLS